MLYRSRGRLGESHIGAEAVFEPLCKLVVRLKYLNSGHDAKAREALDLRGGRRSGSRPHTLT
jgi:hypothetical protein